MSRAPRLIGGLACAMVAGALLAPGLPASESSRDLDCADFPNQAAAQSYFEENGGSPTNNFDGLDGDGDGVACESNPCPCADPGGAPPPPAPPSNPGTGERDSASVVSVTDGDTIKVNTGGAEEDVRIIGIDTPEVYFGAECGGAQASASMKRLLRPGDRVKLFRDPSQDDRDKYDRLLRYVEIGGRDVGRKQVRRGWAQVYVYAGVPFERVRSYRRQRDSARHHDRGAWRRCDGDFHLAL